MALVVEAVGPLMLVEDLGRPGSMHLGVPPSGALDRAALALANRLVGNHETDAGLEVLLGGVRLRAQASLRVAVTGARVGLRIAGRAVSWGTAESVRAGDLVEIDAAESGLRCWLAVSGGVAVDPVLGSRSTDTLTGLGPLPVRVGDVLPLGQRSVDLRSAASAVPPPPRSGPWSLPIVLGPRDDWFTPQARVLLLQQQYVVATSSNRTALRLEGGAPLVRVVDGELSSEGLVNGAVQVPASGQPLVFLADHPVTGGYPVIGVIGRAALAACAQARPGDRLRFARFGR